MENEQLTDNSQQKEETAQYKHCLNCGTELQGLYCHKCGQRASNPTPSMWEFLLEYLNNAFIWDSKFFVTLWNLIRRPGFLTKEFNAGKFVSYEHPLKLNMFFLFVFVTVFFLFSDTKKTEDSFNNLAMSEEVLPILTLSGIQEDEVYMQKVKESPRDSILLVIPTKNMSEYFDIIRPVEENSVNNEKKTDTVLVSIPNILINDSIITCNDSNIHRFSEHNFIVQEIGLNETDAVWREIISLITQYFPLIILLTSPFLAYAVRIMNRKEKKPFINSFIFSLHYTAFMEFLLLIIYLLHLIFHPNSILLQSIMILFSCIYLTIATKYVNSSKSWVKSLVKALLTSLIYLLICITLFIIIFLIAIFIVMGQELNTY